MAIKKIIKMPLFVLLTTGVFILGGLSVRDRKIMTTEQDESHQPHMQTEKQAVAVSFDEKTYPKWTDNNPAETEHIAAVCNAVREMDFTIKEPRLDITIEEDRLYKEAYLQVLKNEMPILEWEKPYYKDLWRAGIAFEDLLERKNDDSFPYLLYYDDLDGDGKPELGINQGCLYLFDYELGDKGVHVLYCQESCYLGGILGSGQIWYHDGLHADVIRDRYVFLNSSHEWEECALDLERGINPAYAYYLVGTSQYGQIDVGEENWNAITQAFFAATEHEIVPKTLAEIFGEMLPSIAVSEGRSFLPMTAQLEEQLYGVWQAKDYVGYTRSSRYQWDGLWGNIVMINQNALIYGGTPYYNPVYTYYESSAEDMESDDFLDLKWTDQRYAGHDGVVIRAVQTGEDGELKSGMPYRFILMGKNLIIERGDSYFELEKAGTETAGQTETADQKMSNSERNYNENVRSIADHFAAQYHVSFVPVAAETENRLNGVWQTKECVGYEGEKDSLGVGMIGDVIIFGENVWISSGIPYFKPVYVYYESSAEDMYKDSFLGDITWLDNWDVGWKGKVIAGISAEKNENYCSGYQEDHVIKMILADGGLIMERSGMYFKLQKIGEAELNVVQVDETSKEQTRINPKEYYK